MTSYIIRRLFLIIPTVFVALSVLFIIFFMLPGDPAQLIAGGAERNVDPGVLDHMRTTELAFQEYDRLDRNRGDLQITFVLIFAIATATIVSWVYYTSNIQTLPAEYGYVGVILITAFTYTLLRLRFVLVLLITFMAAGGPAR